MNATEIRAWIEERPRAFKEMLGGLAYLAKCEKEEGGNTESWRRARREMRLFLRGGLYAEGRDDLVPSGLTEVLDQLEREA